MGLKLITAPTEYPVSRQEAKDQCNIVDDDYDNKIDLLIAAATTYADGPGGFLGRALIDQTWELTLDEFPSGEDGDEIKIPLPPLIEVVSIKYDDGAGVEQTLDPANYTVDSVSEPGWVLPVSSWPTAYDAVNCVRIRFRAGYLDQGVSPAEQNVPENIKQALLILIDEMYENRGVSVVGSTVTKLPWAAEHLLRRSRIDLSMA